MAFEIKYYTMLNHNKEDIEFVTEFPCLLGHPVYRIGTIGYKNYSKFTSYLT